MKKTRIFLGILGLICLVAMPVSAADNVRNITTCYTDADFSSGVLCYVRIS